ncbi:MAG: biotin transporter BioY [Chlamydiota bacterium]|jgi:biotin transport system substrate-specific component
MIKSLTMPKSDKVEFIGSAIQVFLASCFIGLCSQISLPLYFTPVPLTGQTVGVMLVGAALGSRKGAFAAITYLMQGALGYPVFAGGSAGIHCLLGPTGGYLLAYPLEAYLFGAFFHAKGLKNKLALIFIPCLQLLLGSAWLSFFTGIKNILNLGFYPFIFLEITKAFVINVYIKSHKRS